jgi:hypothetical protein
MLDDLTAEEVCRLVQIVKAMPEGTTCFIDDTLHMLESAPGVETLVEKLNQAGERDDVKAYIVAHYA